MSRQLLAARGCQVFPYAKQLVQLATLKLALLPTSLPDICYGLVIISYHPLTVGL